MADYGDKNTLGEEASAFGQRVKGAAKDAAGAVTGDERLEREGERENAIGNERQERNDVFAETPGRGAATTATGAARASSYSGGPVTGLFRDRESAESAYRSLTERGYGKDDVNVLMTDEARKRHFGDDTPDSDLGDKALEGAGVGGAIGGATGAVLAAIAAIGTSVAIPGLGLIVSGPLAAALAGAGAGGLTGGLIGALVGAGIPEHRAKVYDASLRAGGILLGVEAKTDEESGELEKLFEDLGAEYVRQE